MLICAEERAESVGPAVLYPAVLSLFLKKALRAVFYEITFSRHRSDRETPRVAGAVHRGPRSRFCPLGPPGLDSLGPRRGLGAGAALPAAGGRRRPGLQAQLGGSFLTHGRGSPRLAGGRRWRPREGGERGRPGLPPLPPPPPPGALPGP